MPDLNDIYLQNYVRFQLGVEVQVIKGRIAAHFQFWETLVTPEWLADLLRFGVTVPWEKAPPRFFLPNSVSVIGPSADIVRKILLEYEAFGFVWRVDTVPFCVLPLQLKVTGNKNALIYDMSPLNSYVDKCSFKLEG